MFGFTVDKEELKNTKVPKKELENLMKDLVDMLGLLENDNNSEIDVSWAFIKI